MPSTTSRSNRITCSTCALAKKGCTRVARYMLQKCGGVWEKADLEIEEDDFYKWYPEVMKLQSPYVVREGDGTKGKKRASAKGKGKGKGRVSSDEEEADEPVVSRGSREGIVGETSRAGYSPMTMEKGRGMGSGGNKERAEESQNGGRGKGEGSAAAGSESPLKLRISAPSQGSKTDNVIRALQAKVHHLERDLGRELDKAEDLHRLEEEVQRLGDALRTEEERTESLVEAKARYKGMVLSATKKIRVLEAVVEGGEAQAGVSATLRPEVEEYLREKAEYKEWRDTGVRRMELAQELSGAEEDRARLRLRVLALENERKENEQRKRAREQDMEDMEEELRAAVEKSEAVQASVVELVQDSAGKEFSFSSLAVVDYML
jgi:hypothetical protein